MLDPITAYPATGAYVVQLHREARPDKGLWIGRVEHVATGAHHEFTSGKSLIAWLVAQAGQVQPGVDRAR